MTNHRDERVDRSNAEEDFENPQAISPYDAPSDIQNESPLSIDPSVFAEPWMQNTRHRPQADDPGLMLPVGPSPADQSVWDEPGLSRALSGDLPADGLTWFRWYQQQVAETTVTGTWWTTLGVVIAGGILAVVGTLLSQSLYGNALIAVTILGPTTEEIFKIALPLWLVEKRPWLYRTNGQILICAIASGLGFAAVENLIYLNVYVPNPSASFAAWRWTVCVLLHAGCSTVAGIGVVRIWNRFQEQQRAPVLADGARWIMAAIVVHGVYNGTVTALELGGLDF